MNFSGLTRLEAFRMLKRALEQNGVPAAEREAGLIISGVIGCGVSDVFVYGDRPLSGRESAAAEKTLERRLSGMPLQYAMRAACFMGLMFYVDRRVLIPRPETEILVQKALEGLRPGMRALDLCTGSGCIAISLAKLGNVKATASDKYASALRVARKNAVLNGVQDSIDFVQSDLFGNIEDHYDCIASNPPYIADEAYEALDAGVRDYEPARALKAGDGLKYYRIIAREAKGHLKPGGRLLLEIGYDQREAVAALLAGNGWRDIRCQKDYAGLDRIITAKV